MASGAAKVALFDAFAAVAKALGSGRRAEIVDLLAQGERSVDEIAAELRQSVANTSQHLRHLLKIGLVRTPPGRHPDLLLPRQPACGRPVDGGPGRSGRAHGRARRTGSGIPR